MPNNNNTTTTLLRRASIHFTSKNSKRVVVFLLMMTSLNHNTLLHPPTHPSLHNHSRPLTTKIPPRPSTQPAIMATIPSHDGAGAKSPSKASSASSSSAKAADYEAAVTAHKNQLTLMIPTRVKYDALFDRHKEIQARTDKLTAKLTMQRSTYQRHKQYVMSLSNALLASNVTLRSAPLPFGDVQVLTHATLYHELRFASMTLANMVMKNKLLDNEKERSFRLDQEFYARCRELFKVVDSDCRELDRLHAKVLELGEKMGRKPECGFLEKDCVSCARNAEREVRRVVVAVGVGGKGSKGGTGKVKGGMGKAAEGKQRLEDILEEVELKNGGNA